MNKQAIVFSSVSSELIKHKKALCVYSPTTLQKAKAAYSDIRSGELDFISSHDCSYENPVSGYDVYIGFGGGTAIDFAKYFAYKDNKPCVAIPSMLSTNVYATDKVAVTRAGKKSTEQGVLPVRVVYDSLILSMSKLESLYGLADAFSVCTALKDWVIADMDKEEKIDPEIYDWARDILHSARDLVEPIKRCGVDEATTYSIFNTLKNAGYVTNKYGCGRPESGSEHIVAKNIEELIELPHALSVTAGIAIVSQLQGNYKEAVEPLINLGMFSAVNSSKLTPEILCKALVKAEARPGRYTILDKVGKLTYGSATELVNNSGLFVSNEV